MLRREGDAGVDSQIEHLDTGNGDWSENRRLVAYILKKHAEDLNEIYSRLRALEMRLATYFGGALVIGWIIQKYA